MTLKAKRENKERLDEVLAKDWIFKNCSQRAWENFFLPLLKSKFGKNQDKISAAWLASRISLRSNRGLTGEQLGYLKGGFQNLIEALANSIKKGGGKIRTNFEVSKIIVENEKIRGVVGGKKFLPGDKIISTIGPQSLAKILGSNLLNLDLNLNYQGTVCLLLSLKKNLLKDIYWLNIKGNVPFGAIIEHTNFLPFSDYGEHLVYIVAYFQDSQDLLWKLSAEKVVELYFRGLEDLFPNFKREDVQWWRFSRHLEAGPIYKKGYKKKIFSYITPIKDFYLAGMFSFPNYPERSLNGAIQAGLEVAKLCQSD